MICLQNLVFQSGLDLNVESQTWGFWAEIRKNPYASRQACIRATHAVPAAEYLSPLCGRSQRGTQGQRLFLSGPSSVPTFFRGARADLTRNPCLILARAA